jgi:hypothetical protein
MRGKGPFACDGKRGSWCGQGVCVSAVGLGVGIIIPLLPPSFLPSTRPDLNADPRRSAPTLSIDFSTGSRPIPLQSASALSRVLIS